jgi:uncharacterized protein (DUF1330 family)
MWTDIKDLIEVFEHDRVDVIEFSDHATLDNWFNADKHQSLIPLRDEEAEVMMTAYES